MRQCTRCKKTKPLSEFYKDHSKKTGIREMCKECTKAGSKRYQESASGKAVISRYRKWYEQTAECKASRKKSSIKYKALFPLRAKAKNAVTKAVMSGELPCIKNLKCSCGNQAEEYHHHKGYAKKHWLDVIPKCAKCHRGVGRRAAG